MNQLCPLCNNCISSVYFSDHFKSFGGLCQVDYCHCSQCDLVFQDTRTLLSLDDEKKRYVSHNNTVEDLRYLDYIKKSYDFVGVAPDKEAMTVLDFGCGEAEGIKNIAGPGVEVNSYDPFFYPDKAVLNNTYDVIFCIEVVEHFYSPLKEFKALKQRLKPAGLLMIRTGLLDDWKDFPDWWYHRDPTHVCFFSEKSVQWICKELGLELIKRQGDMLLLKN